MTLMSLTHCCRLLAIDPKTLRRWLTLAQMPVLCHPLDARIKGITAEHLHQLAAAHRRVLADFPRLPPPSEAPSPPEKPSALPEPGPRLSELTTQIAVLQQRFDELTHLLQAGAASAPPALSEPVPIVADAPVAKPGPAALSPSCAPHTAPRARSAKVPAKPARVLPLVEWTTAGGYEIICPEHGLLPFEPDTPDWFAWLATRSSFRFVGKQGHLTAHHERERVPGGAWRAHRHLHNRSSTVPLSVTESLTIATLEQAAAVLQAHLA